MTVPNPWYRHVLVEAKSFDCMVAGLVEAATYVARHGHRTAVVLYRDARPPYGRACEAGLGDFEEKIRLALLLAVQDLLHARPADEVCASECFYRTGAPHVYRSQGRYGVHAGPLPTIMTRQTVVPLVPGFRYLATVSHRSDPRVQDFLHTTRNWDDDHCWLDTVHTLGQAVQSELWWPLQCHREAQACGVRARRLAIAQIGRLPSDIKELLAGMDDPWSTFRESLAARGHCTGPGATARGHGRPVGHP